MISFLKKISQKSKRVYLDNAGATPLSDSAKRELIATLGLHGNPSAIHHEGDAVSRVLDKARNVCATIVNAHAYEITFVGSGTESCNVAILGVYEGWMSQRLGVVDQKTIPHVITTVIEHPAVLEPIRHLEKEGKIIVTYIPVNKEGVVRTQDIREAITENTILISVMYANNEIGTLQPVKEIGRSIEEWKKVHGRTHTAYPYFHIDACQAANYCNLDVVRLRTHLMTVNSSKVYGPKGIALLYKREGCLISPISYGGGQERGLRSGTESVSLASSFSFALKESQDIKEEESARLRVLRDYLKTELEKTIHGVIFYGAFDEYDLQATSYKLKAFNRLPNNINCRIPNISSEEMILRLDAKGFAVSHKSACASMETEGSYVVMALGATEHEAMENIRITLGRHTSKEELTQLVKAMKEIFIKYVK